MIFNAYLLIFLLLFQVNNAKKQANKRPNLPASHMFPWIHQEWLLNTEPEGTPEHCLECAHQKKSILWDYSEGVSLDSLSLQCFNEKLTGFKHLHIIIGIMWFLTGFLNNWPSPFSYGLEVLQCLFQHKPPSMVAPNMSLGLLRMSVRK